MEIKKTSKADLEKGKTLSLLMGLVIGLSILFVGFEWGAKDLKIDENEGIADIFVEEEIEITTQQEDVVAPPPPPPAAAAQEQVSAEVLTIVEDNIDVGNQILISSEDTQQQAQTQVYVAPSIATNVVVEEEMPEAHIFERVEQMPDFPGGSAALTAFLNNNIKYPPVAQENGISGRVVLQFVVNQDGSIVEIEVFRSIDSSLDKEAIRVVNLMPKWTPGEQRGKPVRVKFTLPIQFRLQ